MHLDDLDADERDAVARGLAVLLPCRSPGCAGLVLRWRPPWAPAGRPRRYCSDACRQAAYRARAAGGPLELDRSRLPAGAAAPPATARRSRPRRA